MYCTTNRNQIAAELETARCVIAKYEATPPQGMAQEDALSAAKATIRTYVLTYLLASALEPSSLPES